MEPAKPDDSVPLDEELLRSLRAEDGRRPPIMRLDMAGLSHAGCVRTRNEDNFAIARVHRALEAEVTSLPPEDIPDPYRDSGRLLIVADGMGGHAAGEVASRLAIRTFFELIIEKPDWIMRLDDQTIVRLARRTSVYFNRVNQALARYMNADPDLEGMGTTMTAAYLVGGNMFVAHAGDSRAYLLREGMLGQVTTDHTHVQSMVNRGLLTREEAASHGLRHVLSNALGGQVESVEVEARGIPLQDGDLLLLCTDGLTEVLHEEEITEVMRGHERAEVIAHGLVDRALAGGAPDNVTVIVARVTLAP